MYNFPQKTDDIYLLKAVKTSQIQIYLGPANLRLGQGKREPGDLTPTCISFSQPLLTKENGQMKCYHLLFWGLDNICNQIMKCRTLKLCCLLWDGMHVLVWISEGPWSRQNWRKSVGRITKCDGWSSGGQEWKSPSGPQSVPEWVHSKMSESIFKEEFQRSEFEFWFECWDTLKKRCSEPMIFVVAPTMTKKGWEVFFHGASFGPQWPTGSNKLRTLLKFTVPQTLSTANRTRTLQTKTKGNDSIPSSQTWLKLRHWGETVQTQTQC